MTTTTADALPPTPHPPPPQVCGEMALHGHSAPVTCLALCGLEAKDSDLVLSGAADGTALLWSVRRLAPNYISDSLRRPTARRCPALVVRGHGGPVTACAVSDGLGLALTCSDGRALLTAIEGNVLLRVLGQQPAGSSVGGGGGVSTSAAAVDGGGESASGGGGGRSSAAPPQKQQQQLPAARYTACALGETGYCALASSRLAAGDEASAAAVMLVNELEVYTVNGLLTARVSGLPGAVRCLSTAGRGELLVVGGDRLMLEVRTMASLAPVWSLDPGSWVTIDCFSGAGGGGGGVPTGAARGAGVTPTTPEVPPSVECVELGPNPNAPVLVCVGTSDGSLLVQVGVRALSLLGGGVGGVVPREPWSWFGGRSCGRCVACLLTTVGAESHRHLCSNHTILPGTITPTETRRLRAGSSRRGGMAPEQPYRSGRVYDHFGPGQGAERDGQHRALHRHQVYQRRRRPGQHHGGERKRERGLTVRGFP